MTAALSIPAAPSSPTLAITTGRVLMAAGAAFGLSNLFQYGLQSGLLPIHPAALALSWPLAVTVFLVLLVRIRKAGGEAGRRAAGWSRLAIGTMIATALSLLALGFVLKDFTTMLWMSPAGMVLYGLAWATGAARTRSAWMVAASLGAFTAAAVTVAELGTPNQYLAYACGLFAFTFAPGVWLASGGRP